MVDGQQQKKEKQGNKVDNVEAVGEAGKGDGGAVGGCEVGCSGGDGCASGGGEGEGGGEG